MSAGRPGTRPGDRRRHPRFSDPGADLVARAWEAGLKVEAIPGPAAGVAALSLSGFKGDILFVGFFPRGEGRRLKLFGELSRERG